ncbi:MAG: ferredoxin family protein [Planctomycetaceae bacterium]|jgi:NAD-dependent dihydropyrimidine dehydrogenase PreA subunit|nr:ferredoxin family protein [Planctomycetaceae bacterium]
MIATNRERPRVLLYEGVSSKQIDAQLRRPLVRTLLDRGYTVTRITESSTFGNLGHTELIVLGVFDQLPSLESESKALTIHTRDVQNDTLESLLEYIDGIAQGVSEARPHWKPWFPVIDYDRCTNCMQCLSFCLFDVYGVNQANQITVQNQTNCKTDCPACSRVCPEVAILFPKYKAGPINGDEINQDDLRREAMKVDISALLGGDIYSMLKDRSMKAKSRFSKERDDDRALKERQRCMDKLKTNVEGLDIPAEVLSSLPSLDQIQAKAQQAKEKAEQALAQQAASRQQSDTTHPSATPSN